MRVAKTISAYLLPTGCLLAFMALPAGVRCAELPDAPLPQGVLLAKSESVQPELGYAMGVTAVKRVPCSTSSPDGQGEDQNCAFKGSPFRRSVDEGHSWPLSSMGKLRVAEQDLVDPGNLVTIAAGSAISVAMNSHSPYGPGMSGFAKYAGVSVTGAATGEFFCTFLVPAVAHQDPRYHRMPQASFLKRVEHAAVQVVWTKSDNGFDIPNYGNIVGLAMTNAVANLYVPGQRSSAGPTAGRWAAGLASAPIDNLLTEFIPDVAQHVHFRVVAFQRMMDRMTRPDPD